MQLLPHPLFILPLDLHQHDLFLTDMVTILDFICFFIQALQETREALARLNMTLGEMQTLSIGLITKLGKMDKYYKEFRRACSEKGNDDLCKMFFIEAEVFGKRKPLEVSVKKKGMEEL